MADPTPAELLERQRENLAKLGDTAARAARRAAARVLAELRREIDSIPGENYGSWGYTSLQAVEAQVNASLAQLTAQTAVGMTSAHILAVNRAYADTAKWLRVLDRRYLGVTRPLRFDLVEFLTRESNFLINRYERSLAYWGKQTSDAMRTMLQDQMLIGRSWPEAARYLKRKIPAIAAQKQWMVERVAVTEMANAYNGTTYEVLRSEDFDDDPMMKRLVATFDDRTAADSKQLHGQTVPVNKPFINVDGKPYMHPPNRPRDREQVVGWRKRYDMADLSDDDF